ncbi:Maf family nucleotide pyrophosphatase [Candidatus Omnitrophota bacterium]
MSYRKIYLASVSPAREKLLKNLGLRVKVIPSRIAESRHSAGSFRQLAKSNALKKARKVSGQVKSGIIIGADTITVQKGRVFGKPANLRQARQTLRRLSGRSCWVYTGVAVIDLDKKKTQVDCVKTRVFMNRLNEGEIDEYFSFASPLDKAGGFDIQGRGAFFIPRVEGCFYNVIGLPLARLYEMLKKFGVNLLILTFACLPLLFLGGCVTEYNLATKQEEWIFYSTEKEVRMGETIVKAVEKEYELTEDPLIQKRVEDIGEKIAQVCDRKEIDYHFKVIEDEEINAFALPGGFIYVNSGLIERVGDNDDELAGVLAHEVGHVVARHSVKKLQAMMGYNFLRILMAQATGSGNLVAGADLAFAQIITGYSREDELLADQLAARYAKLAGFNPQGMIDFLEDLQESDRRGPLRPKAYFKTHPYVPDRIRVVKQELGQPLTFDDYINIEQEPHPQ